MSEEKQANEDVATVLDQIADLLETQGANRFRIRAYRNAAHTVRTADEPVADVVREGGEDALQDLPNIGAGIARVIGTYVRTGRSDLLDRLKGEVAPGELFTQVPGDLLKTHDWVALYYQRDGDEDQATVVTETHGPLQGKRVVRGRESECRRYYDQRQAGE
ncbi:MAG: hypothetical protein ACOC7N_01750 [Chloroflexota bacterium]